MSLLFTFKPKRYAPQKGINREPGECDSLVNTSPMIVVGSEVTRYGYSGAGLPTLPAVGGTTVTPLYYRYVSVERPSAKEVLMLWSKIGSTYYVHAYSTIPVGSSSWSDGWVLLNESVAATLNGDGTTTGFTGAGTLSAVDDYYNGWVAVHPTKRRAYITDYNGTTKVFTTLEDLSSATGVSWLDTEAITLQRYSHDSTSLFGAQPTYPTATSLPDGAIRGSHGKTSSANGKPFWMGYINRTFFPAEAKAFTYQGTYVSKRDLEPVLTTIGLKEFTPGKSAVAGGETQVETGKSYWFAFSPVYDSYQYGKLTPSSATHLYYIPTTDASKVIELTIGIYPAGLDKRITALDIFVATDNGDRGGLTRINPYYFVKRIPLTDSTFTDWTWNAASGSFIVVSRIDQNQLNNKGNEWYVQSGYIGDSPGFTDRTVDTMYSFDIEASSGDRQWITRVYSYRTSDTDLDSVYTNPRNADGVIQPDVFSNEPDIYRFRVKHGDQTFNTGMVAGQSGSLIVLKDRAVVVLLHDEVSGELAIRQQLISDRVGCATPLYGYAQTPFGLFFESHDDIYKFDGGLTPMTKGFWGETYRAISTANKEAAIVWYRPDEQGVYFQFGTDTTRQYVFYLLTNDWRQVKYAHAMTDYTVKRDGTFVWWKSDGTAYKFDTSLDDAGTGIASWFDSGYMRITPTSESARIQRVYFNRPQVTNGVGSLEASLSFNYEGSVNTKAYADLSTLVPRLKFDLPVTLNTWCDQFRMQYNQTLGDTGRQEFSDVEVHGIPFKKKRDA